MRTRIATLAAVTLLAGLSLSSAALAASDRSGLYIGAYAGPNLEQGHATTTTVFSPTCYFNTTSVPAIGTAGSQGINTTGIGVGAMIGYNWQIDENWLVGVEADFGVNDVNDTETAGNIYPCCSPTAFTVTSKVRTNWLFTARPRLGYAWDDWMAYVTAGLAMTDEKANFLFTDTFATAHESATFSDTKASWTVGGGIEKQLSSEWTARLEYLYADFGSVGGTSTNLTAFSPPIGFPTNVFTHRASLSEHMIRLAFTYHL
jgi:outer membrane immunogenic protein